MNKLLPLLIGLVGHLFISSDLMAQSATNGFTLPAIPDTLQTVESRSSYLVAHYWDRFSFADSLQFMNQPEASVTLNGFLFFYNTLEKYLYDATSPMRNEALFIPVLQKMMASNKLNDDDTLSNKRQDKVTFMDQCGSSTVVYATTSDLLMTNGPAHILSRNCVYVD